MAKILVVDDEPNIREVVGMYLRREGHAVVSAADGGEALRSYNRHKPDLVVLDLMLPVLDGTEVCRKIRRESAMPLVMLTAQAGEEHRKAGLEAGANEYVTKPFSPQSLTSLIEALLRGGGGGPTASPIAGTEEAVIEVGALKIYSNMRRVTLRGESVELSRQEFDLLHYLASRPGRTFTREELMDKAWYSFTAADPIDVTTCIHRLRHKLGVTPGSPPYLQTVWGQGYRFESGPDTRTSDLRREPGDLTRQEGYAR